MVRRSMLMDKGMVIVTVTSLVTLSQLKLCTAVSWEQYEVSHIFSVGRVFWFYLSGSQPF